jgi:hypothetical protein
MTCPSCKANTRVIDSRTPIASGTNEPFVRAALRLVGNRTTNIVGRRRLCKCGWASPTVELQLEDLKALLGVKP